MKLLDEYDERCRRSVLERDEHQRNTLAVIERFATRAFGARRHGRPGLYIWGRVGRGKTLLMDLLYEHVAGPKRRVHFHALLRDIRDGLAVLRGADPMPRLVHSMAVSDSLFCIDELHVADLDTAVVLELLLRELVRHRVVVVTTSNFAPEQLFPAPAGDQFGLGSGRLLSASRRATLELLKESFETVAVDGDADYRRRVSHAPTGRYLIGVSGPAVREMLIPRLQGARERSRTFEVFGRPVESLLRADKALVFDFQAICGGRFSFRDYLSMLRDIEVLAIADVDVGDFDTARRFSWLIEIAYDEGIDLFLTGPRPAEALFSRLAGVPTHVALEYERVVSRVLEMTGRAT